jgi:hypothetical protein
MGIHVTIGDQTWRSKVAVMVKELRATAPCSTKGFQSEARDVIPMSLLEMGILLNGHSDTKG